MAGKRLRYAKWLSGIINKERKGYEMLADCTTHSKVIAVMLVFLAILCGSIAITVLVWLSVNDIELGLLVLIDAALYVPALTWLLVSRIKTKREYLRYCSTTNP